MSKGMKIASGILILAIGFVCIQEISTDKATTHEQTITAPVIPAVSEGKSLDDANLDKLETPVYFTIFKFIINCNPFKSDKVSDNSREKSSPSKKTIYSELRTPSRV